MSNDWRAAFIQLRTALAKPQTFFRRQTFSKTRSTLHGHSHKRDPFTGQAFITVLHFLSCISSLRCSIPPQPRDGCPVLTSSLAPRSGFRKRHGVFRLWGLAAAAAAAGLGCRRFSTSTGSHVVPRMALPILGLFFAACMSADILPQGAIPFEGRVAPTATLPTSSPTSRQHCSSC